MWSHGLHICDEWQAKCQHSENLKRRPETVKRGEQCDKGQRQARERGRVGGRDSGEKSAQGEKEGRGVQSRGKRQWGEECTG